MAYPVRNKPDDVKPQRTREPKPFRGRTKPGDPPRGSRKPVLPTDAPRLRGSSGKVRTMTTGGLKAGPGFGPGAPVKGPGNFLDLVRGRGRIGPKSPMPVRPGGPPAPGGPRPVRPTGAPKPYPGRSRPPRGSRKPVLPTDVPKRRPVQPPA